MNKKKSIKTLFTILFFCFSAIALGQNYGTSSCIEKFINQMANENTTFDVHQMKDKSSFSCDNYTFSDLRAIYYLQQAKQLASTHGELSRESKQYIQNALEDLQKVKDDALKIWIYSELGWLYYTYNYYEIAFEYILKASKAIETSSMSSYILAEDTFVQLSYFYFTIKDYDKSKYYTEKAFHYIKEEDPQYSALQNNLANTYFELQDYEKAIFYYKNSLELSKRTNDRLRYAKVLGDYAKYYMHTKQFVEAERMLLEDIRISKELKADRNTMFAQLRLATMYMNNNEISKSKELLQQAHAYALSQPNLNTFNLELKTHLMHIALKEGNTDLELQLRRAIDSLQQLVQEKDGPYIVEKINWKSQKERILHELEIEQQLLKKNRWLKWCFIAFTALLIVLFYLWIKNFRKKLHLTKIAFEHKLLQHEMAKLNSEKELAQSNRSLASYQIYLKQKQTQIEKLQSELFELKERTPSFATHQKNSYEELLQSHLMTQEKWLLFKRSFIEEQGDFYTYLTENYPGLTESNLRILFLQKLGFTNSETAKILGVTLDAVKKAKQRMLKKFNIHFEELFGVIE